MQLFLAARLLMRAQLILFRSLHADLDEVVPYELVTVSPGQLWCFPKSLRQNPD